MCQAVSVSESDGVPAAPFGWRNPPAWSTWKILFMSQATAAGCSLALTRSQGPDSDREPWFRSTYRWHSEEQQRMVGHWHSAERTWLQTIKISVLVCAAEKCARATEPRTCACVLVARLVPVTPHLISIRANSAWLRIQNTSTQNLGNKQRLQPTMSITSCWEYCNTIGPTATVTTEPFTEF